MKIVVLILIVLLIIGQLVGDRTNGDRPWRLAGAQGAMHFVHLTHADWRDKGHHTDAAEYLCEHRPVCQVLFWRNESLVPTSLPISKAQNAAKLAQWRKNEHTGFQDLIYSCELVDDTTDCFSSAE